MVISTKTKSEKDVESKLIKAFKAALNSDKRCDSQKVHRSFFWKALFDRAKEDLQTNKLKTFIN